ncbi:MAG: hypothetical protein KAH18_08655 [Psychromonas sp.]|nr:hypothetical protein [Psychromonas sp.]
MASIIYDKFGGKYGDFDDREKLHLFSCVCMAQTATEIAYEASLSSFKGYKKTRLETFFGKGWKEEDLDYLSTCLCKLNDFFNESMRTLTFVDARGQKCQSQMGEYEDVRYDIPSERHKDHCLNDRVLSVVPSNTVCFIHRLRSVYLYEIGSRYDGGNPRIYINTPMFASKYTMDKKAESLLHELSHALIDTDDVEVSGIKIYSRETCALLAKKDPMLARDNADSWCFFIMDFLIRPNDLL